MIVFGRDDDHAGAVSFGDSIEHVKAVMLIHAIRSSPGGYKLSNEMVLWLATHFEDCYLPSDAPAMVEMLRQANEGYARYREEWWYQEERKLAPRPGRLQRFRKWLSAWSGIRF